MRPLVLALSMFKKPLRAVPHALLVCSLLSAAAAEDKIRPATASRDVPVDSLTGARHHALEMPITGFYAVFLPKDAKDFSAYLEKHGVAHGKAWYPGGDHQYGTRASEDLRQFVAKWCLGRPAPARKGSLHVAGIRRPSKADSLGLRPGDRIRDYDGKAVRNRDDLKAAVAAASGKKEIKLTVESGGRTRVLTTGPGRLGAWLADR